MIKKILQKLKYSKPHPPQRFRGIERRKILQCPICSSKETTYLFSVWEKKDKVSTKICNNCGVVYLAETLDKQYLEGLGKHGGSTVYGKVNDKKQLEIGMRLMYKRAERYFDFISHYIDIESKSHLDITCQYGGVVEYFSKHGVDSLGIDNAEDLIENGKNYGLNLISGDFLEYTFDKKFDILTMPRVINHYVNPLDYLLKAKSLLNPDGVIFIELLNFSHAIRRKGIYRAINLDHPLNFTNDTLRIVLAQAGLEIIAYSDDLEPGYKFESLNHIHAICKASDAVKVQYNSQKCLNEILIASAQYNLSNRFKVFS